ncbi:MAG: phosphodiester glycosidase family protein [Actinobacteria bacterium]|nr:phosphodiester glycosidase family protein [Actinomycetota bacterium]
MTIRGKNAVLTCFIEMAIDQDVTEIKNKTTAAKTTNTGRNRTKKYLLSRRLRLLRAAALLIIFLMISFGAVSFIGGVLSPGNASITVRWVEWIRTHGGGPIVATAERLWYTYNQPPVGGKPAPGLIPETPHTTNPTISQNATTTTLPNPLLSPPPPITPIVTPALSGEGQWRPVGPTVGGTSAIYITDLRPDPIHTSLVAAVAWMNPVLVRFRLFAGLQEPGGGPWPYMAPIAPSLRGSLAAAFNSGFRLSSANGGYYSNGKTARPLVNGAASLVIFNNGTATVGTWGQDVSMTPNVASVRQNLVLIVNGGQPVKGLRSSPNIDWGATVGGNLLVWRSGVGVTASGDLVYAAGPGLSAYTLANVLAHAGAVRAMELDINSDWVNYFYFNHSLQQPASPINGSRLLPNMIRPPIRYFETTARDFIGVFIRLNPLSVNPLSGLPTP